MNYYVYTYTDPDTDEVFWVGKGSGDRCYINYQNAINIVKYGGECRINHKLLDKLTSLILSNKEPIISKVKYFDTEGESFKYERYLTSEIGLDNLCNIRLGGAGGCERSPDTVKTLSEYASLEHSEDRKIRRSKFSFDRDINLNFGDLSGSNNGMYGAVRSRYDGKPFKVFYIFITPDKDIILSVDIDEVLEPHGLSDWSMRNFYIRLRDEGIVTKFRKPEYIGWECYQFPFESVDSSLLMNPPSDNQQLSQILDELRIKYYPLDPRLESSTTSKS